MKKVDEIKKNNVVHKTIGVKHGDWVIYRCSQCDYELHDNTVTGELKVVNPKVDIGHRGTYEPFEVKNGKGEYSYPIWNRN